MNGFKMGIYNFIGILGVVLGLAKEIIIIILLIKGIMVANIFIRKNKNKVVTPNEMEIPKMDEEENRKVIDKDNIEE